MDSHNSEEKEVTTENIAETVSPETPGESVTKQSVFYQIFSPETRLGRFMRPFLRIASMVAGLFALGVLCTYILLYLPAEKEHAKKARELQMTSQQLEDTREELEKTQSKLKDMQTALQQSELFADYLEVMVDVNRARLALANKNGPEAQQALEDLKPNMDKFNAKLRSTDPNNASILEARLDLVKRQLVSDPLTAKSDLEALYSKLLELEKKLFP